MSVYASAISGVTSEIQDMSVQQQCYVGLGIVVILLWVLWWLHRGASIQAVINTGEHVEPPRWRNRLKMARIRLSINGRKLADIDAAAHGRPTYPSK